MSAGGFNESSEDTFNILVATDCHLGYAERDAVRGNDSFVTFEEILTIAKDKKVDIILLGGDLFHDNKPSRKSLHTCLHLLRKYCMGDNPIQVEFLSDQSENFKHSSYPIVNYEDPNVNISIPVFSIHGNHDDPAGQGNLCTLDLLSVCGLVNYFGKCTDLDHVQISPLLMQKGENKLALYGLGSIRDERLHRLFREGKVTMLRPRTDSEDWFNLFVLHQNRAKHGATNYIPEQFLDGFIDLVIWGHEHECRIDPEQNAAQNFRVSQPGSSIATSLSPGEASPKHIGYLQIRKKHFDMTKIPLQTVRQFYIEDISLSDTGLNPEDPGINDKVLEYCRERVDFFLDKAVIEHTGNNKQPKRPLIRLRVEYTDQFETFNVQRFGQQYVEKVANPKDIVHFHRKKREMKGNKINIELDVLQELLKSEILDNCRVEDLVKKYFQRSEEKLSVLSENGLGASVHKFVEKEEREAIQDLVSHQIEKVQTYLTSKTISDTQIDHEIHKHREDRLRSQDENIEIAKVLEESRKKSADSNNNNNLDLNESENENSDDEISVVNVVTKSRAGRGRGRGRGRANSSRNQSSTRSRGRGKTQSRKQELTVNTVQKSYENQFLRTTAGVYNANRSLSHSIKSESDDQDTDEQVTSKRRKVTSSSNRRGRKAFEFDDDSDNPFN